MFKFFFRFVLLCTAVSAGSVAAMAQENQEVICDFAPPYENIADHLPEDAHALKCAFSKLTTCMNLDSVEPHDVEVCMAHMNMQISQQNAKALDIEVKRTAAMRAAQRKHLSRMQMCADKYEGYNYHYCKFRAETELMAAIFDLPVPQQEKF